MSYRTIEWRLDERILTLILNRPEKLNAFTTEMADELVDAFRRASEDDAVGAIVVTGAGRAFCVGRDISGGGSVFGRDESLRPTLEDMRQRLHDPAIEKGVRDNGGRVTLAIFDCKKPVIAAINGPAVGVGATMTLAMDVRLASESARIGFVFGRLGITPEACASWFLPRLVGIQQALDWVYRAEPFDVSEAKAAGLIKAVYAPDRLLAEAHALARKYIDNRSPVATALARQMLYRNSALSHPLEAHRVESLAIFYASLADGDEGVRAFMQKRLPRFSGKASEMPSFYPWWE